MRIISQSFRALLTGKIVPGSALIKCRFGSTNGSVRATKHTRVFVVVILNTVSVRKPTISPSVAAVYADCQLGATGRGDDHMLRRGSLLPRPQGDRGGGRRCMLVCSASCSRDRQLADLGRLHVIEHSIRS